MFSVTADGVSVSLGDIVYDIGGDGWRVDDVWMTSVEHGDSIVADRKSINRYYSTRERALTAALDVANRKFQEALDAYAAATDQRAKAYSKLQDHLNAAQASVIASPSLGG